MPVLKFLIAILVPVFFCPLSKAQDSLNYYQPQWFIYKGDTMPYRILLPENYQPDKQYPLILILHGSGERGKDNQAQLVHGSYLFLRPDIRKQFPAIVVFPQCPEKASWSNMKWEMQDGKRVLNFQTGGKATAPMKMLLNLIAYLRSRPDVDLQRIYIGGISMGAMGTFEVLRRKPDLFAAAFPICGGDHPANAKKYGRKVPVWIFHGEEDDTVPFSYSANIATRLKELKADFKFTAYPGVKHDSWNNAFAEPELLPWLFSKRQLTNVKSSGKMLFEMGF